ncbi:MAG: phosphoribosylanthranilate isomerase [Thermomicrobiales bacterium]
MQLRPSDAEDAVARRFARGAVVKVCGIREPEHAEVAARAGADILGFIFAPSRRLVTPEVARACLEAARAVNPEILACGVFVAAPAEEIRKVADTAALDLVQLHGGEAPDFAALLPLPVLQVLRPEPGVMAADIAAAMGSYDAAVMPPAAFMLDAFSAVAAGGTGERVDWALAAAVCGARPVMLAGGIDPATVEQAVAQVRPLGVDASSGMEIDGRKSPDLIEAFVANARAGFAAIKPVKSR